MDKNGNYIGCPSSESRNEKRKSYLLFINTNSSHNYVYIPDNYDYPRNILNKTSFKHYIHQFLRKFKKF